MRKILILMFVFVLILGISCKDEGARPPDQGLGRGSDNQSQKPPREKMALARIQMHTIRTALERYYDDHGEYPISLDLLLDGTAPYMDIKEIICPWGNPVIYRPGSGYTSYNLKFFGPDGKNDTDDDIKHDEHRSRME